MPNRTSISSNRWYADIGSRWGGREQHTNSRRWEAGGVVDKEGAVLNELVVLEDLAGT